MSDTVEVDQTTLRLLAQGAQSKRNKSPALRRAMQSVDDKV